jgi:two-component system sensor kinase FixL
MALATRSSATSSGEGGDSLYRAVIETAVDAIVVIDHDGAIRSVNQAAERLFGYAAGDLIGHNVRRLMPAPYAAEHDGYLANYLSTGNKRVIGIGREVAGQRQDGSVFPMELSVGEARDGGKPIFVGIIRDITRRKAAELALRESEHQSRSLAAIVESSDDAIIGNTLEGVVTSWNKAAERIFGYTAEEMIGQSILCLAVPGHSDDLMDILRRIKRSERVEHYETTRRHKTGNHIDVSLSVSPIYDSEGRLVGASKVARDITAAKVAEASLKKAETRLQEMNAELLHASRLSVMGQMASTMAHELNQPLTAVTNYLEAGRHLISLGTAGPARIADLMNKAVAQAQRAGEVIRQLRQFVSKGETERQIHSLNQLVEETMALALVGARQSGVRVSLELDPDLPPVLVDPVQIQQVMLNLVRNALEAMEAVDHRELMILTRVNDRTVEASVADTGTGISPELADRLFQPFVTTKKTGMGLGLSICREIAEAHHGHLTAAARPSGGTIFSLTLPRAREDDAV